MHDEAIKLGHDFAMTKRAFMYAHGEGGEVDFDKAIELYDQAILLENVGAMNNRASMHYNGEGGDVNYPEAIKLYEKAIELGHALAMNNRAWMHYNGEGGDVDYFKARTLLEQACKLKHSISMEPLAQMYMMGQGGDRNYKEAFALLKDREQVTGKKKPLLSFVSKVKMNTEVANLYTQIDKMAQYATVNPDKEKTVRELAQALEEELDSFLVGCYKTITDNNKTVTPEDEKAFKSKFNKVLHSKDKEMAVHSQAWKPIVANILIALSGIGLVALIINIAAHAISSHIKNKEFSKNKAFFFAQTKAEELRETSENHVTQTNLKINKP
jgi:hypothetical protein